MMKEFFKEKVELIILESISDAIVISDLEFQVVYSNKNFSGIFGFSPQEISGQSMQVLFHQDLWGKITGISTDQHFSKNFKEQLICIKKDGSKIDLEVRVNQLKDENNANIGYVFVFNDIAEVKKLTDQLAYSIREMEFANREMHNANSELENEIKLRKRIEEELRQQKLLLERLNSELKSLVRSEVEANREKDRMMVLQSRQASMGGIIENVAHQWKQPLNTISLLLYEVDEIVKDTEAPYSDFKNKITEIYIVIQFMATTIDEFRNFFIPGREIKLFNIAGAIRQTSKFLDAEYRHSGIEIIFNLDETLNILGFQNEFTQVVLNILNNARDAFVGKENQNPHVIITLKKIDNNAVIEIEDNAGGIPEEILPDIFNAYISTKHDGSGTGLGLYIVKSIIEKNLNGSIVASNSQSGAKFSIKLPIG